MEQSRRDLLRSAGKAAAVAGLVATVGIATANTAAATQSGWRWCINCSGLWFGSGSFPSHCPNPNGNGAHAMADSGNYRLLFSVDPGTGQTQWRFCKQCDGLWFSGGDGDTGACPGLPLFGHSMTGSGNYKLEFSSAPGAGQSGWRYCDNCRGLWFPQSGFHYCPAGGTHILASSGNYKLRLI
jgi:hypothetical protein